MTKYQFSAKNNAFIPLSLKSQYIIAGWDLSDAKDISDKMAEEFMGSPPKGKMRIVDDNNNPSWGDVNVSEFGDDNSL